MPVPPDTGSRGALLRSDYTKTSSLGRVHQHLTGEGLWRCSRTRRPRVNCRADGVDRDNQEPGEIAPIKRIAFSAVTGVHSYMGDASSLQLSRIPGGLGYRHGIPRPGWPVIDAWLEQHLPESEMRAAYEALSRDWLELLAKSQEGDYAICESDNFLLLSTEDQGEARKFLDYCESCLSKILPLLSDVASDEGCGKHVVIRFGTEEQYHDYVDYYCPEAGELLCREGLCIPEGYVHFVLSAMPNAELVIAHEMTNCLLDHLPMPLWIHEGLSQVVEHSVSGYSAPDLTQELARQHQSYWTLNSLEGFWSGEAFLQADAGRELGYSLAEILMRNMMEDFGDRLKPFLRDAHFRDAGGGAAPQRLECTLGSVASQFLGAGSWEPEADDYGDPRDIR